MGAFPWLGQDAAGWELAMLGGRTRRWRKSQGGEYGNQGEDTANSMVGQTPGPGDTKARGHQDLGSISRAGRGSIAGCSCQHFGDESFFPLQSILEVQGLNMRDFRYIRGHFCSMPSPLPTHTIPGDPTITSRRVSQLAICPTGGAPPWALAQRSSAEGPWPWPHARSPPAAHPSASWPHRGGSSFQRAWEG